jgi:hypothetical protein
VFHTGNPTLPFHPLRMFFSLLLQMCSCNPPFGTRIPKMVSCSPWIVSNQIKHAHHPSECRRGCLEWTEKREMHILSYIKKIHGTPKSTWSCTFSIFYTINQHTFQVNTQPNQP